MLMLDAELNRKIIRLAPTHVARDTAPGTFQELAGQRVAGRLVVWSGASDLTIYGDARVNHAFRAWHDALHLSLNAPFTLEGETRVAIEQARLIGSDAWAHVVLAEVVGQAEYLAKHGSFPADQTAFILSYLKTGRVA